jgi:hypothetical protein
MRDKNIYDIYISFLLGFSVYATHSCPEAFLTTSEGDNELLIPMALHP